MLQEKWVVDSHCSQEELFAKLLACNPSLIQEEWLQLAKAPLHAIADVGAPSPADVSRLQEAYDCCNKVIGSVRKTCHTVLQRSSSSSSSSSSSAANVVSTAREAVAALQQSSLKRVDEMQWQEAASLSVQKVKETLKECAQELAPVVTLEKELKALLSVRD